jgi:DNA/RNA endonuclease YhcR with UshA esterase domain
MQAMRVLFSAVVLTIIFAGPLLGQEKLSATEAKNHMGEKATVCGTVASTHYAESTKGQPTFLNLDRPYPQHIFTILIWGADRRKFGNPEVDFMGKRVCVTGKISAYRGIPEVVADEPEQLKRSL